MSGSRFGVPYSEFLTENFRLIRHSCIGECFCQKVGCTEHYVLTEDGAPNKEQIRYMLATWQAFRTPRRNGESLMNRWLENFDLIVARTKPLSGLSLFCDWEKSGTDIEKLFDDVKEILFNSVVCTTKTLHCLVPDLFIILDRKQVYRPWRDFVSYRHFAVLPGSISDVSGKDYVACMKRIRSRLSYVIENKESFMIEDQEIRVWDIGELRWLSPLMPPGERLCLPNTIGKVLDNFMGRREYEE